MAKEAMANPARLERRMQDIAAPVIPGPTEPRVETASPYHIEAHEENSNDTMERSSQQAVPHSPLKHSDPETDTPTALKSSTGAVAANNTKDLHPHERERETEREWEHELARRAGLAK